ncbi:unnamed protein product, partial [Vitis vinifera]
MPHFSIQLLPLRSDHLHQRSFFELFFVCLRGEACEVGWVMEGVRGGGEDDVGEGMQCSDHPYRNNPGGICAFCLQEKLGKLIGGGAGVGVGVGGGGGGASSTSLSVRPTSSSSSYSASKDCHYHGNYSRRARIPFLLAQKKKKKKEVMGSDAVGIVLKRSKSTTTPRRGHFLVESEDANDYSPQKRGFWSFLYLPKSTATRKMDKAVGSAVTPRESKLAAAITQTHASLSHKPKDKGLGSSSLAKKEEFVDESESPNSHATASSSSFGRKVSRSRSVGCGSRSFSGDFFERISTGFGDCTLRRVESQREGKPKSSGAHRGGAPDGVWTAACRLEMKKIEIILTYYCYHHHLLCEFLGSLIFLLDPQCARLPSLILFLCILCNAYYLL